MKWCLILISFFLAPGVWAAPVQLILDTDMGPDYDDVGAMAVMHTLADRGEVEILATTSCNRAPQSVPCIEILNSYYGRSDLPVGSVSKDGLSQYDGNNPRAWPVILMERYPKGYRHQSSRDAPDAVQLYRRILAAASDHSVTIASLGFFTNLKNLLLSQPDQHSPLDGKRLVQQKVKRLVSMVGQFPKGKEWNAMTDPIAAKVVFDQWPTPILCSGFEIGKHILTGKRLIAMPVPNNPVKDPYVIRMSQNASEKMGRMSWDQTAVLVAVRGPSDYFGVERGVVRMDNQGGNTWQADPQGPHARLLPKMPWAQVAQVIEDLMMAKPKKIGTGLK